MSATITATTGGSTEPYLVMGYETRVESTNITHQIIGGGIAVALAHANPRTGVLRLLYRTEAAAFDGLALHGEPTTFTLSGAPLASMNMTYAVARDVTLERAVDGTHFVVSVGYQEVAP